MEVSKRTYDEINEVQSWLYEYKSIKASIENLKEDYEDSKDITLSSADPGKENFKTNKINSTVENSLSRKELLRDRIDFMENKIKKLDRAIDSLTKDEKLVILSYYMEGKRFFEFCNEVNASESTCKRIKRRALNKIRIAIFGKTITSKN